MVRIEIISITHYGLTGHVIGMEFGYTVNHDDETEEFIDASNLMGLLDSLKPESILDTLPYRYRPLVTVSGVEIGGVYYGPEELGEQE